MRESKYTGNSFCLSGASLSEVLEIVPVGIAIVKDGGFLFANPAMLTILGATTAEQLVNRDIAAIIYQRNNEPFLHKLQGIITGSAGQCQFDEKFQKLDGKVIDARVLAKGIKIGNEPAVQLVVTEITRQAQAQNDAHEAVSMLRLFIEHAQVSLAMFDTNMNYIVYSNRWLEDYSLQGRDLRGLNHYEVFPEIGSEWKEIHRRALNGEVVGSEEDRFQRADGNVQWLRWEVRPWYLATGKIGGIMVFSEEITRRKRAEEIIRESDERHRAIISNIPGGLIHIFDRDMRYVFNAGEELTNLGLTNEYLVGKTIHEVLPQGLAADVESHYKRVLQGETVKFEGMFGGNYYGVSSAPLKNSSGQIENILTLSINITERKRAELNLAESEARYRSLFENMNAGFVLFEVVQDEKGIPVDLVIVTANKGFEKTTGLELDKAIGKRLTTVLPGIENDEADWVGTYSRVALTGKPVHFEQGSELLGIYYSVSAFQAGARQCAVTFVDITERKLADESNKAERDFSDALLDGLPGIFYFYDNDFKFLRWNKNFETVSGYSADEITNMSPLDFFPDSEKDLLKERIGEVFTKGYSKVEADFLAKDGTRTPYFFNGFKFSYNNKDCLIGIGINITERIEAEKEVNVLIKNLHNLTNSVKKLSLARDLDSIVSIVKKSARDLADADGVSFVVREGDLCYYFDEDAIEPLWKGKKFPISNCVSGWAMLNNKPAIIEDIFNDHRVPAELYKSTFVKSLVMIPVNTYEPVGAVGYYWSSRHVPSDMEVQLLQTLADATGRAIENVTLYNELEKKVESRTLQLESANKELESFSYSISHDLRAPLRAIYGFSQILAQRHRDSLNPEGKQYMSYIVESSKRMEQLINDLLNYTRLGRKTLESRVVSLLDVINSVVAEFKSEVDQTGGKILVLGNPPPINSDESLLRQVFNNLIENAIKYRRAGIAPLISVSFETYEDHLIVKVADNGIGIPEEYCEKIFNVFQRLHAEDKYPGTGIGLANVRKAATMLGATIHAESMVGEGTTFILELPRLKGNAYEETTTNTTGGG